MGNFRHAAKVEVRMDTVFISLEIVHQRQRYSLSNETEPLGPARFIGEDDVEEYRGEPHRIEADIKSDSHYFGSEVLRGTPNIVPQLRRIGEDGGNYHDKTIIARSLPRVPTLFGTGTDPTTAAEVWLGIGISAVAAPGCRPSRSF